MKRRKHTKEFTQNIMKEAEVVGNITVVARKHNLNTYYITSWIVYPKLADLNILPKVPSLYSFLTIS